MCDCLEIPCECKVKPTPVSGKVTTEFLLSLNNKIEKSCGWPKSVYKEAYNEL